MAQKYDLLGTINSMVLDIINSMDAKEEMFGLSSDEIHQRKVAKDD